MKTTTKLLHFLSIGTLYTKNQCNSFTINNNYKNNMKATSCIPSSNKGAMCLQASTQSDDGGIISSRRHLFTRIASSSLVAIGGSLLLPHDNNANAAEKESIIWKSGKEPIVPGKKPRDKNDTSGSRKDGDFLRSISNCKVCSIYVN